VKRATFATSLVLLCLVTGSCARLGARAPRAPAPPTINPSSAIALSVLADSIYLIDPRTGALQPVARGLTDFQSGYAAWSPDHRFLAWGNGGITVLDTATGKARRLDQGQSLSMPAWSPDGKRIAFGDGTQLWTMAASGGSVHQLTIPPTIAPLAASWAPAPTLAFDGLRLDCAAGAACVSTDASEIWTIQPDSAGLRQITRVGHAENPKWSPDGTKILFVRRFTSSKTPRSELWVIAANGRGAERLGDARDVVAASWSPTGREIAVVRKGAVPNTLQVWLEAVDGSNPYPVGDAVPGTDATIDW